ncbi:hypothetical protein Pyn_13502 [Prunus yedoensis var. nudiflora]|uniref:Uncharacterized protein n=1 Tax=Prunus yedoensis var. nudiflora TaxID=2094558 RepID=A0A314XL16_PRUYE|nr:hypothetical protein Pyn_13502 [Prunus yedoensis var. nudiflora]
MEPHWKKLGGGRWERDLRPPVGFSNLSHPLHPFSPIKVPLVHLSKWDGIGVEEPLKFLFTRLARGATTVS